jgi:hypothetical protein
MTYTTPIKIWRHDEQIEVDVEYTVNYLAKSLSPDDGDDIEVSDYGTEDRGHGITHDHELTESEKETVREAAVAWRAF